MNPSVNNLKVGIVGATGAVGQELIRLLHERKFPLQELVLLASARSVGKKVSREGKTWIIDEAKPEAFDDLDLAIFSASGSISSKLAPEAVNRGCIVVD
ncbi:MAG: aspartate-semialdehyde dehydrogenase, partial [Opitutae bacterium]|nr:aspartate-semialdehyde dehydrogenase [Opitutae bacterium]